MYVIEKVKCLKSSNDLKHLLGKPSVIKKHVSPLKWPLNSCTSANFREKKMS